MPKTTVGKSSKQRIEQAIAVAHAPEPLRLLNDEEFALWDTWVLNLTLAWIHRGILGSAIDVAAECTACADELIKARRVRR